MQNFLTPKECVDLHSRDLIRAMSSDQDSSPPTPRVATTRSPELVSLPLGTLQIRSTDEASSGALITLDCLDGAEYHLEIITDERGGKTATVTRE